MLNHNIENKTPKRKRRIETRIKQSVLVSNAMNLDESNIVNSADKIDKSSNIRIGAIIDETDGKTIKRVMSDDMILKSKFAVEINDLNSDDESDRFKDNFSSLDEYDRFSCSVAREGNDGNDSDYSGVAGKFSSLYMEKYPSALAFEDHGSKMNTAVEPMLNSPHESPFSSANNSFTASFSEPEYYNANNPSDNSALSSFPTSGPYGRLNKTHRKAAHSKDPIGKLTAPHSCDRHFRNHHLQLKRNDCRSILNNHMKGRDFFQEDEVKGNTSYGSGACDDINISNTFLGRYHVLDHASSGNKSNTELIFPMDEPHQLHNSFSSGIASTSIKTEPRTELKSDTGVNASYLNPENLYRLQQDQCIASPPGSPDRFNRHEMGDLGTPVAKVGSPAVLHDLDYNDLDCDDSIDDLKDSKTYESNSKIAQAGSLFHNHWAANSKSEQEFQHIEQPAYGAPYKGQYDASISSTLQSYSMVDAVANSSGCSTPDISMSYVEGDGNLSNSSIRESGIGRQDSADKMVFMNEGTVAERNALSYNLHQNDCCSDDLNQTMKSSSMDSGSGIRPLPDQSAFESSGLMSYTMGSNNGLETSYTHRANDCSPSRSFVCPPTPQRGNSHLSLGSDVKAKDTSWNSSFESINPVHESSAPEGDHDIDEAADGFAFDLANPFSQFGSLDKPIPIHRSNSLVENKTLLTQSEQDSSASITFNRDFQVIGVVGSGTFADVYKVKMLCDDDKFYAVKKSKRQFRSKREREWLMAEVRTMKLLGQSQPCPYVVPFIRAWQEDSYFFVQMGFAERGTLKDLLQHIMEEQHIPVPDVAVWHVVHDVSAGLSHIHGCGMVHLDIKPANLLVTEEGLIQIGDFGMAAQVGSREDGHEGDTRYMAEELLNNPERRPPADIFSLGLTLYEICRAHESDKSICLINNGSDSVHNSNSGTVRWIRLPSDGPLWRALREGRAERLKDRPAALTDLIMSAMQPAAEARPTAAEILHTVDSSCPGLEADKTLLSVEPKEIFGHDAGSLFGRINRSVSFNPTMVEGTEFPQNGLALDLPTANDLMRSITPLFTPKNFS